MKTNESRSYDEYELVAGVPLESLRLTANAVFDDLVVDFLSSVSEQLFRSHELRAFDDLVALSFWLRRANLHAMASAVGLEKNRLGRGVVLHIAPSNVALNFAYSFALGLLAGNSNIVRLPSAEFPQIELFAKAIRSVLDETRFSLIARANSFVRFNKNSNNTALISAIADARMIWGGDATIDSVRKLASKSRCIDIPFADRYSMAIISCRAIMNLSDDQLKNLSAKFLADTLTFDQNACSSPQLLYWISDCEKVCEAKLRLRDSLNQMAREKYELSLSLAVKRYSYMCNGLTHLGGARAVSSSSVGDRLWFVSLERLPEKLERCKGFAGIFYEYCDKDLDALIEKVDSKIQTITYFGVDPSVIARRIVEDGRLGVDRIVPFGKALEMSPVWDGNDLFSLLSRTVYVEQS